MSPTNREPQIGGAHYGAHEAVQPIDLIEAMDLDFSAGSVIKYTARFKNTRNLDDLRKAQWYLERIIQRETEEVGKQNTDPDEEGDVLALNFEPTNICQADAEAARRFAGEITKLEAGLRDLGLKSLEGYSVDRAPVASALHHLAELKEHNRELTDLVRRPRLSEPF